ncbi:MAG: hypothetical protein Q9195_004872 [Heterodermia aff. obscurata]
MPPSNIGIDVPATNGQSTTSVEKNSCPKFLIIGAGARGNGYAHAVTESTNGIVAAVAEPISSKREALGRKYIWLNDEPQKHQSFQGWQDFVAYEYKRRQSQEAGEDVPPGIDGVFICVLDELHVEVILGLQELSLHIMCEKPLATSLDDCLRIYRSLQPPGTSSPNRIFSVGHVLRYSPHNMLLRQLLLSDRAIGDIISIEHTEPIGWWHFSHSYVRGNWRQERTTAPSLLTKSCHDIDFLLWLLCSPPPNSPFETPPHLPSHISSTGSLHYFKRANKPPLAGSATNCLSCPAEPTCLYSAPRIYLEQHLGSGNTGWPVHILVPDIEDLPPTTASALLRDRLAEDYSASSTPPETISKRPWFGRCVYESDNDVCDDQSVTITWDDDPLPTSSSTPARRSAKTALFHMTAFTEAQCARRGRVYGTRGEICYDSRVIEVYTFADGARKKYFPEQKGGGHGGGDEGLAGAFVDAVEAVGVGMGGEGGKEGKGRMGVEEAQRRYVGCTLEEAVRSHAVVFAAEEARRGGRVVEWRDLAER